MPYPTVVPSKDVRILMTAGNLPSIPLSTATALNITDSKTLTPIYAIGSAEPLTIEDVNAQYTATLTLQTGELDEILNAVNGALGVGETPYATLSQVQDLSLTVSSQMKNAAIPITVSLTLVQARIDSSSSDYNRNDPETLTTISFQGVGYSRRVTPLTL